MTIHSNAQEAGRELSGDAPSRLRCVVVVNDYLHIQGGASRVAVDEAVALAEAGVRVIFFGANGPACPELQSAPIELLDLEQPELLEAGKSPGVLIQGLWNQKASARMAELLRGLDPASTIVHLHGYTKAMTTAPVHEAVRRGFEVVCTLHDFFCACPNGAFFDYRTNQPCTRTALSASCVATHCDKRAFAHKAYRVVRSLIQRQAGLFPRTVRNYIALSKRSSDILRPYLPADARIHPIENISAIDKRPPVDVRGNGKIIAVGRLEQEKGIVPLLEAAKRVNQPIVFVGDGPLRSVVEDIPGMTVTGWISADEVVANLEQARALVFPSLWYETYGLVVSEAAARGVPAIVSDISAASERIVAGSSGWIFRSGNVAELADCLVQVGDDDRAAKFGLRAYEDFWAAPPDLARHTRQLLAVYEEALSDAPQARAAAEIYGKTA